MNKKSGDYTTGLLTQRINNDKIMTENREARLSERKFRCSTFVTHLPQLNMSEISCPTQNVRAFMKCAHMRTVN